MYVPPPFVRQRLGEPFSVALHALILHLEDHCPEFRRAVGPKVWVAQLGSGPFLLRLQRWMTPAHVLDFSRADVHEQVFPVEGQALYQKAHRDAAHVFARWREEGWSTRLSRSRPRERWWATCYGVRLLSPLEALSCAEEVLDIPRQPPDVWNP